MDFFFFLFKMSWYPCVGHMNHPTYMHTDPNTLDNPHMQQLYVFVFVFIFSWFFCLSPFFSRVVFMSSNIQIQTSFEITHCIYYNTNYTLRDSTRRICFCFHFTLIPTVNSIDSVVPLVKPKDLTQFSKHSESNKDEEEEEEKKRWWKNAEMLNRQHMCGLHCAHIL